MSAALSPEEVTQRTPVPRLVVDLPPRARVFADNLRDLLFPRRLPPLELHSTPADFWPDVFIQRRLPWRRFLQSTVCHVLAVGLLIILTRFFALQPKVIAKPAFERSQVIYYRASEYLPPLDTRAADLARPAKADPELGRQPIISVPSESENRFQTVVTPPNIRLNHDAALPNIIAWSDTDHPQTPQLEIPPVPLTPAAEITRIAPQLENAVAAPPPDVANLSQRRNTVTLQNSLVAPPPELAAARASTFRGPQPAVVAPPPKLAAASQRPLGELNIGPSAIIAPAPRLSVAVQRAVHGSHVGTIGAPQLVPPPPAVSGSDSSGAYGSRGRLIALNLHPAVGAPPNAYPGNRRGTFAAAPNGHIGASGNPGGTSGTPLASGSTGTGKDVGDRGTRKRTEGIPSGLYVGKAGPNTAPVPANESHGNLVNPNLLASVRGPRITDSPSRAAQPGSAARLSEPERAVFGDRKVYSLTLNMPNLNSAGGSWVIRFAELNHDSGSKPAVDLSQPYATRKVDPAYPMQLMRENVAGTVILYAVIHADGTVGSVRVLRGVDDRLDQFAREAVAQWQFHPATKNGTPVDVEATFQIPFKPSRFETNF